jgi:hypothetical protein
MALPVVPLLIVAAAGLAAGVAGSAWLRRRAGAALGRDRPPAGVAAARPVTTLPWCPVCRAHMAVGHACGPAGDGRPPP